MLAFATPVLREAEQPVQQYPVRLENILTVRSANLAPPEVMPVPATTFAQVAVRTNTPPPVRHLVRQETICQTAVLLPPTPMSVRLATPDISKKTAVAFQCAAAEKFIGTASAMTNIRSPKSAIHLPKPTNGSKMTATL